MSIHDKESDSIQPEMVADDDQADVEVQNKSALPVFLAELHKEVMAGEIVKVTEEIAERLHRVGVLSKEIDHELADKLHGIRDRSAKGEIQGGVQSVPVDSESGHAGMTTQSVEHPAQEQVTVDRTVEPRAAEGNADAPAAGFGLQDSEGK